MTRWAAIHYRDLWDFPHIFVLTDRGQTYLFDCPFSDESEDYADEYHVYLMPTLTAEEMAASWAGLYRKATAELGRVPTAAVRFDPTRRQFADASVIDTLPAAAARAPGGAR